MKDYHIDGVKVTRRKGSDKARERFARNGLYSTKHLRIKEAEKPKQSKKSK